METMKPRAEEVLLDVGGSSGSWTWFPQPVKQIDLLNVTPIRWDPAAHPGHRIQVLEGDGRRLPFSDGSYGIVFSNSVIEHLGTWDAQRAFAAEARRVGQKLWIQTPAREFVVEPHYLTPFIHWAPRSWRRVLARNFTVWGWLVRPSPEYVEKGIRELRLLTRREMRELFPDCEIRRERFLGLFTKSHIAVRR